MATDLDGMAPEGRVPELGCSNGGSGCGARSPEPATPRSSPTPGPRLLPRCGRPDPDRTDAGRGGGRLPRRSRPHRRPRVRTASPALSEHAARVLIADDNVDS